MQAAHSGYAGLISMLTAADLLSAELRGPAPPTLSHDIVFVSLTAESAGLTGSRRLLFELERGGNSTAGIALGRVDAVVEVGMTAAPPEGGVSGLFVHSSAAESAAAAALQAAARPVQNARVRSRLSSGAFRWCSCVARSRLFRVRASAPGTSTTDARALHVRAVVTAATALLRAPDAARAAGLSSNGASAAAVLPASVDQAPAGRGRRLPWRL